MPNSMATLDFRLLRIFVALHVHRNVSRAAEGLEIPQPAVSQGLARLRILFDDPLFVRMGKGMAPTERATELREPVESILAIASQKMFGVPSFDVAQTNREFRIITTEFGALTILPSLFPRLRKAAPHASLRVLPMDNEVFERLASREGDIALGIMAATPRNIRTRTVFQDEYACVLRDGHPALRSNASKKSLQQAEHVVVSSQIDGRGALDSIIQKASLDIKIVLRAPSYAVLPSVLSQSDLVALVPRSASRPYFAGHEVRFVEPPFRTPAITVVAAWHAREEADLGLRWLLDAVEAVFDDYTP
jgi:DNA-binding transcriptional LysR family regulator